MKKTNCLIIILVTFIACRRKTETSKPNVTISDTARVERLFHDNRIIVKETLWNLAIIEIDSVEYLSNSKGGLIPLTKK